MGLRDERIEARISVAERALLERIAQIEHVGASETVRLILRDEGRRRGLWPPERAAEPCAAEGGAGG